MTSVQTPKFHLFLAGVRTPMVGFQIICQHNYLALCHVSLPYSPWIINLRRDTKFQIWRQDRPYDPQRPDDPWDKPELEFDGVVVAKSEGLDVNGNASFRFSGHSDGVAWQRRKQLDCYLEHLGNWSDRGLDARINLRIGSGNIMNFFSMVIKENSYDVGMAYSSVLTSTLYNEKKDGEKNGWGATYEYVYNGKQFRRNLSGAKSLRKDVEFPTLNPTWYKRFLDDYKLAYKVYGVPTNEFVRKFLGNSETFKIIGDANIMGQDLQGLTPLFTVGATILNYGAYDLFNIPRPTFLKAQGKKKPFEDITPTEDEEGNKIIREFYKELTLENRAYSGLAEFIIKPETLHAIPPKCNVIFPKQIISMSMDYNFSGEPTRIRYTSKLPFVPSALEDLTSVVIVGPSQVGSDRTYFSAFSRPKEGISYPPSAIGRADGVYSVYEEVYGAYHRDVTFNSAQEETFRKINIPSLSLTSEEQRAVIKSALEIESDEEIDRVTASLTKDQQKEVDKAMAERVAEKVKGEESSHNAIKLLNGLINYHFIKSYLENRPISIRVDSTVDAVPGHGILLLSNTGAHIVAYCVGYAKSWSAQGSYDVSLLIKYPRYYWEDVSGMALEHDPILGNNNDETALKISMDLVGSTAIMDAWQFRHGSSQAKGIEKIFKDYTEDPNGYVYPGGKRSVATFKDFVNFHRDAEKWSKIGEPRTNSLPFDDNLNKEFHKRNNYALANGEKSFLSRTMDSPTGEPELPTSTFFVENRFLEEREREQGRTAKRITEMENSTLIERHTTFIGSPKRL